MQKLISYSSVHGRGQTAAAGCAVLGHEDYTAMYSSGHRWVLGEDGGKREAARLYHTCVRT